MPRPASPSAQLKALLIANYISWFGNGITIVAVPLYVLAKTGSTIAASVAGAANALPLVLSGIAGGALVDRWGARRCSILADALAGLCTAAVPLLDRFDQVPFAAIVALLFLRSLFNSPASVARLTLLPLIAEAAGIRKQTANTLYQLAPRIALMLGPVAAGTMAAVAGPVATLALDALTFAVSAALVAAFVRPAPQQRQAASLVQDIRSGFGFVRRKSGLVTLMFIIGAMNFIDEAFIPVLLPVYSRDVLADPRLIGWLLGANGLGAVLGTVLYLLLGRRFAALQWETFVACVAVLLLTRFGLAGLPGLAGASLILFVFGIASGPLNPIINTLVQDATPPALRGRVFGILGAVAFAAAPVGILVGGWAVVASDLQTALLAFAGLYAVVLAAAWRSSGLRALADSSQRLTA